MPWAKRGPTPAPGGAWELRGRHKIPGECWRRRQRYVDPLSATPRPPTLILSLDTRSIFDVPIPTVARGVGGRMALHYALWPLMPTPYGTLSPLCPRPVSQMSSKHVPLIPNAARRPGRGTLQLHCQARGRHGAAQPRGRPRCKGRRRAYPHDVCGIGGLADGVRGACPRSRACRRRGCRRGRMYGAALGSTQGQALAQALQWFTFGPCAWARPLLRSRQFYCVARASEPSPARPKYGTQSASHSPS